MWTIRKFVGRHRSNWTSKPLRFAKTKYVDLHSRSNEENLYKTHDTRHKQAVVSAAAAASTTQGKDMPKHTAGPRRVHNVPAQHRDSSNKAYSNSVATCVAKVVISEPKSATVHLSPCIVECCNTRGSAILWPRPVLHKYWPQILAPHLRHPGFVSALTAGAASFWHQGVNELAAASQCVVPAVLFDLSHESLRPTLTMRFYCPLGRRTLPRLVCRNIG